MIGIRAGLVCGVRAGVAAGVSADPIGGAIIPLVLMFGDSQIPGEATTDTADPAFNVTTTLPTTFVQFDMHYSQAASDPIVYQADITGGVRPYSVGGTPGLGMQVTLGQVLAAAQLRCVLASFGIFGLACSQSIPASTYPTQPPAGPNVLAQVISRTHALEAQYGAQTRVILLSEGNNDGANSTDANALAANSATLATALLAAFPAARLIWIKINADTVNASGETFESTCISQQATFFAANPSIVPIYNDDCALLSDHAHFAADTALTVGQRVGYAALDLISVARARPATFPAVLGFGPQAFSAGAATNPHSWGGAQAGDLEILIVASLTASGVNNALTTPSGWTLIGTTSSATGGATTRAGFYSRVVDASMISTNHLNTAPTTVAAANTNEFSEIITIRGPNANPTVDTSALSVNNAFNTSLVMTGVTTSGANRAAVLITVGFRTNQTANTVTLTGSNLTGLTAIKNGTRDSGLSNFCTIDVQVGQLAAAGSTGSPTATYGQNTIAVGAVIAIAP